MYEPFNVTDKSFESKLSDLQNTADSGGIQTPPPAADPAINTPITQAQSAQTNAPTFDLSSFNLFSKTKFNKEFKDENELTDYFSIPTKYTELETKFNELNSAHELTKKERDDIKKQYDETGKFVNPNEFIAPSLQKINQVLLKYGEKYTSPESLKVLTEIANVDLDKIDNVDVLVKLELLKDGDIYKGMTDAEVKEVVLKQFNADPNDVESWDNVTKASIAKSAKNARLELKELQSVELPATIDVEKRKSDVLSQDNQRRESIKTQLSTVADKMLSNMPELIIPDPDREGSELYKYKPEITDDIKEEMSDYVDYLSFKGVDPTNPDVINSLLKKREEIAIHEQLPKILKAVAMKIATEKDDFYHNKDHNDSPLSTQERPPMPQDEEIKATVSRIKSIF
jgi:hypothetical protein